MTSKLFVVDVQDRDKLLAVLNSSSFVSRATSYRLNGTFSDDSLSRRIEVVNTGGDPLFNKSCSLDIGRNEASSLVRFQVVNVTTNGQRFL
jgi:hypothetical protein